MENFIDDFMNNDYNYDNSFSMSDLDQLLDEIKKDIEAGTEAKVPLTKKKPSVIRQNNDIVERQKEEIKFNWLNELYIRPLLEFSKRIAIKEGKTYSDNYSNSDYSIMERMLKLRNELIEKGCSIDIVTELVPKTVDEINTLLQAAKIGFDLGFEGIPSLTNNDRVFRANKYIVMSNMNLAQDNNIDAKKM